MQHSADLYAKQNLHLHMKDNIHPKMILNTKY